MKTIKMQCLEGVCPLCGCTDLNYGVRDIDAYEGTAIGVEVRNMYENGTSYESARKWK